MSTYNYIKEIYELPEKIINKIAKDWVELSANVKKGDKVMIIYDIAGRQLAKKVGELSGKKGARVWYRVRELEMEASILPTQSQKDIARYFQFYNNEIMQADVIFMIRAAKNPNVLKHLQKEQLQTYIDASKPVYTDYRVNYTNWNLIYWPMPIEAEIEGLTFEEYINLFINACNQPWEQIKKAHYKIKEVLDKGNELVLIANPNDKDPKKRTYLKMSIKGMEFMSSTIKHNYPGSEVFSSPVKETVNGQLFGQGKYMLGHSYKMIEDFYFKVENGKIVDATAKKGEQDLIDYLNTDEGSRYFGEVAFGTNPGLRQKVFNPLLNEKIGGSFHITPGNAYNNMQDEEGNITKIDNGNKSKIHWDITIPMLPKYGGGKVIVDGKTIQKNGKWLIKGTEVLNRGL